MALVPSYGTSLALSAATVTYGKEQAEKLSATVTPQHSGTPAGTVTVKSGTTRFHALLVPDRAHD